MTSMIHKAWLFRKVSEEGNFKSTASKLHITASALTQAIKSLETYLEQTLLIRNKGSVSLTPHGQDFLMKMKPILNEIEFLDEEFSQTSQPKVIKIGAYDSLAIKYLPKLYKKILELNPEIKIDIKIGRSAELCKLIHQGHLDLALVVSADETDSYTSDTLGINSLSMYTHKDNLNNGLNKELKLACLSPEVDGRQSFIMNSLSKINLKSKDFHVQADSFECLLSLCLEKLVVALLPCELAARNSVELVDVSDHFGASDLSSSTQHPLSLITRKTFPSKWKKQIESTLKDISLGR